MSSVVRTTSGASFDALDRFLRGRLLRQLDALHGGEVALADALGTTVVGESGHGPAIRLHVHDAGFYRALAGNGSVGAAEAFMDGHWDCSDLVGLVRLLVRNRDLLDGMEGGPARLGGWALKAWHALRRNTRDGARRNIAAHYDLGNPFFRLFLSDDLMYSSALYAGDDDTLEVASTRKLDRICDKLRLGTDDHVVEIGTGWGGFAVHAARTRGCRVTTTTISREQHALATQRVVEAGLQDRVAVLLSDYRDLTGQYDKLVSIEMIEAVGQRYLPTFFRTCQARLRPGGRMAIQAITIQDQRYRDYSKSVDFIQRYIFPGGFLPSITAMNELMTRHTDFVVRNLFDMGPDYARTLAHWRQRFVHAWQEIEKLGFDERFRRMWLYYFGYCEAGFNARTISVVQLTAERTS